MKNDRFSASDAAPQSCPVCGSPVPATATVCPSCGVPLVDELDPETMPITTQPDSPEENNTAEGTHIPRTVPVKDALIVCSACGYICSPNEDDCPRCGTRLYHLDPSSTIPVAQDLMITRPVEPQAIEIFEIGTNVILQLSLSGGWLSLALDEPIILGRGPSITGEKTLDLTDFGGYEQGMSRRHVILRRSNARLKVADLGSANGTYLNGKQLIPHVDYTARHGDQLMLGRMQITILFSVIKLKED